MICEDNPQCLFDLAITEETTFAMETLEQEKVANTTTKTLGKIPTLIGYALLWYLHSNPYCRELPTKHISGDNLPSKHRQRVSVLPHSSGSRR